MFANFDVDAKQGLHVASVPGPQWKLCQQLCASLCTLGEQCSEIIAEQIRISSIPGNNRGQSQTTASYSAIQSNTARGEDVAEMAIIRDRARLLQGKAFEAIGVIMQAFLDGSSYVHDEIESPANSTRSTPSQATHENSAFTFDDVVPGNEESHGQVSTVPAMMNESEDEAVTSPSSKHNIFASMAGTHRRQGSHESMVEYWQSSIAERRKATAADQRKKNAGASLMRARTSEGDRKAGAAKERKKRRQNENEKEKAEDTVNTAFDIMKKKSLKKALDYLIACNFLAPSPRDIASFLRLHMAKMDPGVLGDYLGEGGKDGTEVEYWNLIRFNYVRAISFVGMNVEQALRHFLTNCGFRLPGEAQKIDRIMTTFSQCYWEDNAGDRQRCPYRDQDTVFLIAFAIIMLNTDLHKSTHHRSGNSRKQRKKMTKTEFLNNLRGVDVSEELSRDYLANIYDSIEAYPIVIEHGPTQRIFRSGHRSQEGSFSDDLHNKVKTFVKSSKPAEELLRGMSVHEFPFYTLGNVCDRTGGDARILSTQAVKLTWHHFHSIIKTTLDAADVDPTGMDSCLDILKHALCVTVQLDMRVEFSAFVAQLARVKLFKGGQRSKGRESSKRSMAQKAYKQEDWHVELQKAINLGTASGRSDAIEQISKIFKEVRLSGQDDTPTRKGFMQSVVRRIENGQLLLNDPARSFIREGDLIKKSNRTGRSATYRFFLFSDVLIYAKKAPHSKYKIHEQLPLHLIKIVDIEGTKKQVQRTFEIRHPRKSFLVMTADARERDTWVDMIQTTARADLERKARLEGARMASEAVNR